MVVQASALLILLSNYHVMYKSGFIVQDMAEFFRVTTFDLNSNVPLEAQRLCPACESDLEPLAVLLGNSGRQKIQLGFCPKCGYVGYIDRPAKDWMVNFYATVWDTHIARSIEDVRNQPSVMKDKKSSRRLAISLAESLHAPKDRPVCEIGSGYGSVLKYFKESGFKKVYGTENSGHRARTVSEALDLSVFAGNFEGDAVQRQLKAISPIGLFFSHHVFEHVYHPAEVIRSIAALQEEGDHVLLALPGPDEHAGYGLFYVPHLHVFTKESLELLLNRFGYELVGNASPDNANMILAFKKVAVPEKKIPLRSDYRSVVFEKYCNGLGLTTLGDRGLFEYRWLVPNTRIDDAEMVATTQSGWWLKRVVMFVRSKINRFTSAHHFLVQSLDKKMTDTPIEIQYPGNIQLLMK